MKKIVALLLLSTFLFGAEYKEFAKTMAYETEYEKALVDKSVDSAIKSKYIPLIINKEEKKFPAYLTTPIVPTTYFINPHKEEILHQSVGFSNKIEFLNLLQKLE